MAAFNTIDEILADMRNGKMAVLMDDEDRENEGDLIMAAQCVRTEDVNFMSDPDARALPAAAPAADGERYRQHAPDQLHAVDRSG